MSENDFGVRELRENLMRSLLEQSDENNGKLLVRNYLSEVESLSETVRVNDFKKGLEWMNVKVPLSFKSDLKGKIVILDFFTYCCINCMHILPDLKYLENKYTIEDGLVVVGVHSPKFSNEKQTVNVAAAVKRYEISHAVVNDSEETMWEALGVCCWPTLVIVGPNGEVLLELMGEGHRTLMDRFIGEAINFFKDKGTLLNHSIPQIQPFQHSPASPNLLFYPGKVAVNDNVVAVADTGNHRIVIIDILGNIKHIIGGPESGFCDGNFTDARFHSLQGLVFYTSNILFVADTENHAVREINLMTNQVKTVVGTGKQGNDKHGGKLWAAQEISSPWDLCIVKEHVLLIAMAGTHQIWALFLEDTVWWKSKTYAKGTCTAIAGSGREENRNNSYPMSAAFAQPSGLSYSKTFDSVFIADSESSAIRRLQISDGQVSAVVGGAIDPRNLFGFGDIDGAGTAAKLQHPLGVAWCEDKKILYVADTYNHKLKFVNPADKNCSTFLSSDGKPLKFNEPAGLCIANDQLFVADTNNHEIVVIDLKTNASNKLVLQLDKAAKEKSILTMKDKNNSVVYKENVQLQPQGGTLNITINVVLSDGIYLTDGAPSSWNIHLPSDEWLLVANASEKETSEDFCTSKQWNVKINKLDISVEPVIKIDCIIFYCVRGVCKSSKMSFLVNVESNNKAGATTSCSMKHVIS